MPELPEVSGLVGFLTERLVGRAVVGVELASFAVLKTFDPPPQAFEGLVVDAVHRHGKFVDIEASGLHFVFHLSRAGWLRWSDNLPTTTLRPGKSPIAVRVRLDDGAGFDLTEAGTQKRLAVYLVRDVQEVPGVAKLGIDPLSEEFTEEAFAALVAERRMQIKGLLRDQSEIAGVGNAYSDEVLHVAKLSPFAMTTALTPEQVHTLYEALRTTLTDAVAAASGKPAKELKDAKRAGMRVHGRTGEACPVCGDVVREVSFADRSLQYCATCQTGGKPLADRRMSKLLK
ncbi:MULTISPECIES: Fpg/Nei family DNA glycosylase [Dermacoccus]|jgi:formamidopyrimidine-DNA glycosylase|uniref:Fpg/Nei family DNA glycosylase n=1 Tax=Dermacoccus abyssi TaxID=322596 RepID=A0ABX5Z6D1_9MICO|nr:MULTISPECIES: DNA-formamidopyrimidine glycosylase family protein [Dermacoccus]KLO63852.1 DNA lyase [Dermacoccus sp. PE3]MBE7372713.1 Fpg/Nei family DNA glycosylase [Dermacoccus barathri]MBZ4498989.1 Fpg/Nei family DNA glycosylase [Dermacoccus sp. Tok2021]QEH92184.1 Fpg/Nei family DNA glycosylase [Dermacoccus abyssi]QNK53203.1 Fpg/Nei family DNA glycosylase [Dermacoccus sp. PAMC28757]